MSRLPFLKEPLFHFFAIGFGLFALYGFLNPGDTGPESRRISIGDGEIERITAQWRMQMRRPPTARELQGLLQDHLREEVLYREARAMGLDEDDTIVRRRMAQKMTFLMKGVAEQVQPSDEDLRTWFEQNTADYEVPARVTLQHVYFNVDRRGDAAERDARALLASLRQGGVSAEQAYERGDAFMMPSEYEWASKRELGRAFGRAFVDDAFDLEKGAWHGPVVSGYGLHLVRIVEREEAQLPDFSDVQNQVAMDWRDAQVREAEDAVLDELLGRYDVQYSPAVDSLLTGAGIQLTGSSE